MAMKPGRPVDLGELVMDVSVNDLLTPAMDFSGWRGGAVAISIDGPAVLTGTVTVQVSNSMQDTDEFGTTWRDKQSAGADIVIPADGHVTIQAVDYKRLRLSSGSAEADNRRFRIIGYEPAS